MNLIQNAILNGNLSSDVKLFIQEMNLPVNIYDQTLKQFIYVSPQFLKLSSLKEQNWLKENEEYNNSWLDDQDIQKTLKLINLELAEVSKKYNRESGDRFYYMINFRLREKGTNNKFKYILVQSYILKWDKNNQPSLKLNLFTDMSQRNHSNKIILSVYHSKENVKDWNLILNKDFLREPVMLAKREKELLNLILDDKSAIEIAALIKISVYTVRSHWRSILQKTNCQNQKELKVLAYDEGWL